MGHGRQVAQRRKAREQKLLAAAAAEQALLDRANPDRASRGDQQAGEALATGDGEAGSASPRDEAEPTEAEIEAAAAALAAEAEMRQSIGGDKLLDALRGRVVHLLGPGR